MNLYAIAPQYAPNVSGWGLAFMLAKTDEEALNQAIYHAAKDAVDEYGSTNAEVYLVVRDVEHVGTAYAKDAPKEWAWAHPGVEEALANDAAFQAQVEADLKKN